MAFYNQTTDATLVRFRSKMKNGELYYTNIEEQDFSCGEFFLYEKDSEQETITDLLGPQRAVIKVNKDIYSNNLDIEIIEKWLNRIGEDLGIHVEYIGTENKNMFFDYILPTGKHGVYNLFRFTMFRYCWGSPQSSLLEYLYSLPKKMIDEIGFWRIFSYLHAYLASQREYDETFGLAPDYIGGYHNNNDYIHNMSDAMQSRIGNMVQINEHYDDGITYIKYLEKNSNVPYPSIDEIRTTFNLNK